MAYKIKNNDIDIRRNAGELIKYIDPRGFAGEIAALDSVEEELDALETRVDALRKSRDEIRIGIVKRASERFGRDVFDSAIKVVNRIIKGD